MSQLGLYVRAFFISGPILGSSLLTFFQRGYTDPSTVMNLPEIKIKLELDSRLENKLAPSLPTNERKSVNIFTEGVVPVTAPVL